MRVLTGHQQGADSYRVLAALGGCFLLAKPGCPGDVQVGADMIVQADPGRLRGGRIRILACERRPVHGVHESSLQRAGWPGAKARFHQKTGRGSCPRHQSSAKVPAAKAVIVTA